jgi:hypothetical protein
MSSINLKYAGKNFCSRAIAGWRLEISHSSQQGGSESGVLTHPRCAFSVLVSKRELGVEYLSEEQTNSGLNNAGRSPIMLSTKKRIRVRFFSALAGCVKLTRSQLFGT